MRTFVMNLEVRVEFDEQRRELFIYGVKSDHQTTSILRIISEKSLLYPTIGEMSLDHLAKYLAQGPLAKETEQRLLFALREMRDLVEDIRELERRETYCGDSLKRVDV